MVRHCSPSPPHRQQRLPSSRRWRRTNNIHAKLGCLLRRINEHGNSCQPSHQYVLLLATSRAIRQSIPTSTAVQLINSLIISHIDYCNNLLAGLPVYQLDRVQSILNFAARLIYGRAKYDHITPIPRDKLHWLRVPERIKYKCCLLVCKVPHGLVTPRTFLQESSCPTAARAYVQPPEAIINLSSKDQASLANDHLRFPAHQSETLSRTTSYQPHLLTLSKIDLKLICLVCRIRSASDCFVKRLCF